MEAGRDYQKTGSHDTRCSENETLKGPELAETIEIAE